MKIIISPAKKMHIDTEYPSYIDLPKFIDKAEKLADYMRLLSFDELKKILNCNDEIAKLNYERYQNMNLRTSLSAAILTYDGIQYKYMSPQIFEDKYFQYIQKNLRILSGFYGILKPLDGIVPYRLEMQAKLKTDFCRNLYDYWKDLIFNELISNENEILNLASEEYSKTISKYLTPDIRFVSAIFGEFSNGKIKEKGVYVKMARGEMVRYMAENEIHNIEDIKNFDRLGFSFSQEHSTDNKYVFLMK